MYRHVYACTYTCMFIYVCMHVRGRVGDSMEAMLDSPRQAVTWCSGTERGTEKERQEGWGGRDGDEEKWDDKGKRRRKTDRENHVICARANREHLDRSSSSLQSRYELSTGSVVVGTRIHTTARRLANTPKCTRCF